MSRSGRLDRERTMPESTISMPVRAFFFCTVILHVIFIVSLFGGFLDPLFVEAVQGYGQASDWFGIYRAGANLASGYSIYDSPGYRSDATSVAPYYYFYRYLPPTAYASVLVASILGPWPSYWLLVLLNECILLAAVASVLRSRRWHAGRRLLAACLWLGYFPLYIEQFMGQLSLAMAVLMMSVWLLDELEQGKPGRVAAACAWTASIALKSFPVMLAVPFLRDGKWKRVLWGAGAAAAVSSPYFIARPEDLVEFLRLNLSPFSPEIYKGAFGFQTFVRNGIAVLDPGWLEPSIAVAGGNVAPGRVIMLVISAAFVILAFSATLSGRGDSRRRALDLAIWTAVFFLIFKGVWEYHYVMILPAVTALYLVTGSRFVFLLGAVMGLPTLFASASFLAGVDPQADLSAWPPWFRVAHFGVKCVPVMILFVWCLRQTGLCGPRRCIEVLRIRAQKR